MEKLLRFAIFFLLLLTAGRAFAQGGVCPTGATYANPATGIQATTLGSLGVTSCFYISAAGTDTNSGTSESSPWAHAPGMPNCSGVCASTTPAGGEGFVFRGGDTWHFGATTTPAVGGTWSWSWSGSGSSSPIYIGVDPSWYSGSSWARPIMNGDNPTSATAVSSCAYQIGGSNQLLNWTELNYNILDNFELTGLCQNDSGSPWEHDVYLVKGNLGNLFEHLYIHGWTHVSFSSTMTFNMEAMVGGGQEAVYQVVVDGSDSDPSGAGAMFEGGWNISQSVFRYAAEIVVTQLHSFHDNLIEHWYQPGDGLSHGNVLESSGEPVTNNAIYNNVFRYIGTDLQFCGSGCSFVNIWPQPSVGYTDYFFNNVEYNTSGAIAGNFFNVGQNSNSGNQGTIDSFNNTWVNAANGAIMTCAAGGFAELLNVANNQYITNGGSAYANCPATITETTELLQSQTTASSQGYSASSPYGYIPTSSSGSTVGAAPILVPYIAPLFQVLVILFSMRREQRAGRIRLTGLAITAPLIP